MSTPRTLTLILPTDSHARAHLAVALEQASKALLVVGKYEGRAPVTNVEIIKAAKHLENVANEIYLSLGEDRA